MNYISFKEIIIIIENLLDGRWPVNKELMKKMIYFWSENVRVEFQVKIMQQHEVW